MAFNLHNRELMVEVRNVGLFCSKSKTNKIITQKKPIIMEDIYSCFCLNIEKEANKDYSLV